MRALLLLGAALASAAGGATRPALRVERAVLVMRHGVRPPTKAIPLPPGSAAAPWPTWDVPPGHLTAHGAEAVRALGRWDRRRFAAGGLLPSRGCPAPGTITLVSDSDQRTIATGNAWAAGFAPGCAVANRHRQEDVADPLFSAAGANGEPIDPVRANAAVAEALGPGGIADAEQAQRSALVRLDRILCGTAAGGCGIAGTPTAIQPATADRRPRLTGALDLGSTAAQILLLEYADGKPAGAVGWGRATAADVTALSTLHAAEFAILARPRYLAARNAAPLVRRIAAALAADDGAKIVAFVGHDTNVASIGGLLGLHWQTPGFAVDDPPPGGALLFRLLRDPQGRRYVDVEFRAQSLAEMRAGRAPHGVGDLPAQLRSPAIEGCARRCPLARFLSLVDARLR